MRVIFNIQSYFSWIFLRFSTSNTCNVKKSPCALSTTPWVVYGENGCKTPCILHPSPPSGEVVIFKLRPPYPWGSAPVTQWIRGSFDSETVEWCGEMKTSVLTGNGILVGKLLGAWVCCERLVMVAVQVLAHSLLKTFISGFISG
jgi:hypothetical protein